MKKLTFRKLFLVAGNLASLVAGVLVSSGKISADQGAAIIGIGTGLGTLAAKTDNPE